MPAGRSSRLSQFSHSVVSNSLQCCELEHTRPSLSINNSWSLLKLMSIASVMPSNHLILCCPLLPPPIFPSIRVFSNESVLHITWPKYWHFSFNISLSNLPAKEMREMQVRSLGRKTPWSRKWRPTPVFLPGKSL